MAETTRHTRAWAADITALVARVAVGLVFIAHGLQKLGGGVGGTAEMFAAMGIPLPQVAAVVAIVIEVGAGAALLIGLGLPVAGILLAAQMLGAFVFVHTSDPLLGGYELVLVLGAAALASGFNGGTLAVDRFLPWGRSAVRATEPVSRSS
ncbi:DoxX family protein [Nocardiopsis ansamitocini]|uniref:DoxX family protein n=1 Tax=Nocardiopsis ansamitocini TaxID=1670832 RepID=A0A9W6P9C9_9ACTN|nr:DoxX family protein [Nocardiopsis ansamitocini]GLU49422.1 hypothetical protein Nans01_37730 [Nocardiopsis ansamitocini]